MFLIAPVEKLNMPEVRSVTHLHLTGTKPSEPGGVKLISSSIPHRFPFTQRQQDGSFLTQAFEASQEAFSAYRTGADDIVPHPTAEVNFQLIRQFSSQGFTGNEDFDKRVRLAIAIYRQGLEWIKANSPLYA